MSAGDWLIRTAAVPFVIWGALRVRRAWRRAGQVLDDTRAFDAAIAPCDPCNGKPGVCRCKSKALCSHPLCGADDTRVSDAQFSRELRALLDREGGGRG